MKYKEKWHRGLGFFVGILCFFACSEVKEHPVPDAMVNVKVNLMDPVIKNALHDNKGVLYLPDDLPEREKVYYRYQCGYGGIVVYQEGDKYFAYDRTCTYNVAERCKVGDSDGTVVKCPCCDSEFLLFTGEVVGESKAKVGLRKYQVQLSDGLLYIYR